MDNIEDASILGNMEYDTPSNFSVAANLDFNGDGYMDIVINKAVHYLVDGNCDNGWDDWIKGSNNGGVDWRTGTSWLGIYINTDWYVRRYVHFYSQSFKTNSPEITWRNSARTVTS